MCSNPSLLCCCMFLARQRCYLLLKLFGVRCGVNEGGGSMCEKREGTKEERKGREGERAEGREGERMMGQVWNLHTPPVAHTIGIRALV